MSKLGLTDDSIKDAMAEVPIKSHSDVIDFARHIARLQRQRIVAALEAEHEAARKREFKAEFNGSYEAGYGDACREMADRLESSDG